MVSRQPKDTQKLAIATEQKISTEELKEKLEIAVSEERYEDAAILRDLVRELERVG